MLPLLANSITADMSFLPGMAMFTPLLGVPLSIVAAIIERPVYSLAGVGRNAIWHSIRANCVSLLAGYVLVLLTLGCFQEFGLCIWPIGAVFLSTWIERRYLTHALSQPFSFWTVFLANFCSAICCCCVAFPLKAADRPEWRGMVQPYHDVLSWTLGIGCGLILLAAMVVPMIRSDHAPRVPGPAAEPAPPRPIPN